MVQTILLKTMIENAEEVNFPEYRGDRHHHKKPYMLSTPDHWLWDFSNFMNSAVLISVVADRINYEKVREWGNE